MHLPRPALLFAGLLFSAGLLPSLADVTGQVTLKGTPNSEDETFYAKSAGCGESPIRHTENWKVGPKGELADVAIWIVDPKCSKPLGYPVAFPTITQLGCRYEPHVVVMRTGPLEIINGDATLHNIRAKAYDGPGKPPGADIFNFGQSYKGQNDERTFDQPGIYTLQCNVHSWMQAWVMVLPAAELPWCAVSDSTGNFKIIAGETLTDGDYKIDAWHPRFPAPLEQTLHVKNGTAKMDFQFDGTKSL